MTIATRRLAAEMLDRASRLLRYRANTCELPNTDDNWALVTEARRWAGMASLPRPAGESFEADDWLLMAYLSALMTASVP